MKSGWIIALVGGLVACGGLSELRAGKPAPPPPNPFAIYEWRPDLGGWLDTQRNLVWGYDLGPVLDWQFNAVEAAQAAATYPTQLADGAAHFDQRSADDSAKADSFKAKGDAALAAGDQVNADKYYATMTHYSERAEDEAAAANELEASAAVASQYSGWRVPTKDEAQDASSKGFFTYGTGGFNGFDDSPLPDFQPFQPNFAVWTSTRKTGTTNWAFFPIEKTFRDYSTTRGYLYVIVVRTHTP